MEQGKVFKSNRYRSKSKSKSKGYGYDRIGRAKCYSHGSKGLYRLRNTYSCDKLKDAGCVWKDDDGGFCDLPFENNSMMNDYLSKSKSSRTKTKGAIRKRSKKGRTKSKGKSNSVLKKLSKTIDSKIKKYKRTKKTKRHSKKSMSTGKGGLKIFKQLKSFLKAPVWSADPPSMSELGRFTIRGEDDVNLLNRVQSKIQEVSDYRDNQVYCSNCDDAGGGCVMCHQH
jgi:hypothetical protein